MKRDNNGRNGATLVVVIGIMLIGALITASVMARVNSRVNLAFRQVHLEEAFHVAEGGAERAAATITVLGYGNVGTRTINGSLGRGHYTTKISSQSLSGGYQVDIISTGTVNGVSRVVKMSGVQRVSWARYALWYNKQSAELYMIPGEKFHGLFYSKPLLRFSNKLLAENGQVRFYDRAWTGQSTIHKESGADPVFDRGLIYSYHSTTEEDMLRDVDFATLKAQANSDMIFKGPTTIVLNGKKMTVTNTEKGYTNKQLDIPSDGLIYIQSYNSNYTTFNGDLTVSAPDGLNERVTLVAENDILIPDHIKYKNDPSKPATANSTDALGLIAKKHVRVTNDSPKNLYIFAHIICQKGGFGVDSYQTVSDKGTLTVYGGIVNDTRNGVGQVSTDSRGRVTRNGYAKDYIFDKRFNNTPPPFYPEIPDQLEWSRWEG